MASVASACQSPLTVGSLGNASCHPGTLEVEPHQLDPPLLRIARAKGPLLRRLSRESREVATRAGFVRGGGDNRTILGDDHTNGHSDRPADGVQCVARDI